MLSTVIFFAFMSWSQATPYHPRDYAPASPPWSNGRLSNGYGYPPYESYPRNLCAKRYGYNPVKLNWDSARLSCLAKGGLLASITSQRESSEFKSRFKNVLSKEAWLGGSERDRKGLWQWDIGRKGPKQTMYFTNWARREPKWGKRYTAYCLLLVKNAQWESEDCSVLKPSICEYTICSGRLVMDGSEENSIPGAKSLIPNDQTVKATKSNAEIDSYAKTYVNDKDNENDLGEYSSASASANRTVDDLVNATDAALGPSNSTVAPTSIDRGSNATSNTTIVKGKEEDEEDEEDEKRKENEEEEGDDGLEESASKEVDESKGKVIGPEEVRKAHLKLLSLLLDHVAQMQRTKRPCEAPPSTNGVWNCNKDTYPWICILDCDVGRVAGDGIVDAISGIPEGDGVIICHDGLWSRDDFYCVPPPVGALPPPVDNGVVSPGKDGAVLYDGVAPSVDGNGAPPILDSSPFLDDVAAAMYG